MSFEWTAGMANPEVIRGTVVTKDNVFKLNGFNKAFVKGELIRITATGTVERAALDTETAGSVHGMALADAADYATGDLFPVALFDADTELMIQLKADENQNDVEVGASYTLEVDDNKWTLSVTTTNGNALVVDKESNLAWFDPKAAASIDRSRVVIRFVKSIIDGRAAATAS